MLCIFKASIVRRFKMLKVPINVSFSTLILSSISYNIYGN